MARKEVRSETVPPNVRMEPEFGYRIHEPNTGGEVFPFAITGTAQLGAVQSLPRSVVG